ncbi:hypothetical protein GQ600_9595 [Phytophthora cactorum]|nr:hypothetical protein GQ600_9595 [Phytophthora cactorum]
MHEAYAFLEPWCAVLRGRLAMENRFSDNLWLSVRPPLSLLAILNREAAEIRLLREALELLSLVAIVDNEACKFLLLERCDLKLDDQFDEEIIPRFIFRFDTEHLRYSALLPSATIRQFFLGHRTSAAFQAAHPYTLQFTDLWNVGQSVLSAHWSTLLVTLDEIQKRNEGHKAVVDDGDYFVYELESVQICFGTIPVSRDLPNVVLTMLEMPDLTISELQVSLEQELQIGFFRPGEIHPQDLAAQCRCGMLFNTIFCGRSITKQQVQTVVDPGSMDDQTFSGLCTSLAEASEVRKLTINGAFRPLTPTQRTWRWQWLTYALFSDASRSSIEEINMSMRLLTYLKQTYQSQIKLQMETLSSTLRSERHECEYQAVNYQSKYHHNTGNFDDFTFRLLQNDEESGRFNVLVPGRGNGVISSHQAYKVLKVAPSSAGITSLSLSIDSNAEQEMAVCFDSYNW